MSKKILFYTPMSLRFGGGFEEWIRKTAAILSKTYEVTIAYGDIGSPLRLSQPEVDSLFAGKAKLIKIEHYNMFGKFFLIKPAAFIKLKSEFSGNEKVYFNVAFFMQEIIVYILRKLTNARVVAAFHSPLSFSPVHDWLFKVVSVRFLRKLDGFQVLNKEDYQSLQKYSFSNVHLIGNYLMANEFPPQRRPSRSAAPVLLFCGRYESDKGVNILIEALRKTLPHLSFTFHFYGSGILDNEINRLCSDYPGRVMNHGFTRDKDKIYADKEILVAPSRHEQFPMVLMEAMSYGVVPIASITKGAKMIIKNGDNGFLIPEYSTETLEAKLTEVLEIPPHKIDALGRSAQNYVFDQCNEVVFKDKFQKLIKA